MTTLRRRYEGDDEWREGTHTIKRIWPGRPDLWFYNPCVMPPKSYSVMIDELGPEPGAMKECYHVKFYTKDGTGAFSEQIGAYVLENNGKQNVAGLVDLKPWVGPVKIQIGESEIEAFNKRAIEAMKPTIKLAMDMPTFLTELKSLPDLFKSGVLKKFFGDRRIQYNLKNALLDPKSSKQYLDLVKSKIEKYKSETFAKSLAGDYLNLQFGWLPTLADAKALYKTMSTIEKQLDRLFAQQGEVFTSHYTEELDIPEQRDRVRLSSSWPDSVYVTTLKHTVKVTATLKYSYNLDILRDLKGKLPIWKAYLDAFGFNNPLRTIWERVPFSFVVDWIVPVGDFLEQFSIKWIDTKVDYLDYCISQKTKEPVQQDFAFQRDLTYTLFEDCGSVFTDLYLRKRSLPNDDKFGLRVNDRFGTKQAILSGALATTFFGGNRKPKKLF